MEEKVLKELDVLKGMLENWKTGYLSWASPGGDNEHILMEFREEIQTNLYPYVRRLFETKYLTESEAKEFMVECFSQVEDLRDQLRELETKAS